MIELMKYLLKYLQDWVDNILVRLGWKNTWRQVAEIIVKIWWRNTRGWVDEMLVSLGWWSWMQIAFLIVPPVINLSLGCIQFKPFHTSQMPFLASILQYHFHHVWGEHVDFLGMFFFNFEIPLGTWFGLKSINQVKVYSAYFWTRLFRRQNGVKYCSILSLGFPIFPDISRDTSHYPSW